jgi:hypothetical protein
MPQSTKSQLGTVLNILKYVPQHDMLASLW